MAAADRAFDVIVVGAGPAGVTAALRARELGARVALVERGNLGGTCTNDGCVPTRVLAHAARLVRDTEQFAEYGLVGERPTIDFPRLLERTQHLVYLLHEKKQLRGHLEAAGVAVYAQAGMARFVDAHTLTLGDGSSLRGDTIILCAGGHARRLAFPGSEHALTHSDVWSLKRMPRSVAVVGGAATGCQLASVFAAFGSRVALLEVGSSLLNNEDAAVSEAITRSFEQRGIEVITGIGGIISLRRAESAEGTLALAYQRDGVDQILDAEAVVLAVGWPGNVDALNLAAVGVHVERGYIVVDDTLRTTIPSIFAAGDITGRMMLVQSAGAEALLAAENAVLGTAQTGAHRIVPHGGFTDPEYGSVGLSEARARALNGDAEIAVALVPYAELDRALIDGRADGFCKLIVSRASRQVLGAHIVGEQAVEIIQLVAAAMTGGMTVEQLAQLELAYPTFTTVVGLAARRLTREPGIAAPAPHQPVLARPGAVEWERNEV